MSRTLFHHKAGILLPISALPSRYGIGTLGEEAYRFVDFLSVTGQKYWQVLPVHPTAYGDSPYQTPSSMAGNPYFISPEYLYRERLITREELRGCTVHSSRIDYGRLFRERYPLLRLAFSRFCPSKGYHAFLKKHLYWLLPYALFMSLKVHYDFAPFTEWEERHRTFASALREEETFHTEMEFWYFTQYCFFSEWQLLHAYSRGKGVFLIGDLPIYMAHDSAEVWSRPDLFLLDEKGYPTEVAGCPPDAFSEDGQLWGNPLYRWDRMEEDGFAWWCERISHTLSLYDVLRLDHFRGFSGYYAIPYGAKDAREGKWYKAPGQALFTRLREKIPKVRCIAEDLGHITQDVRELLLETGFPGMKMLHFAFGDEDSEYLPRNFETKNCVVYTASHDSQCTASWLRSLPLEDRARFHRECPHRMGQNRVYDLIEFAMRSPATLAIVPMQDYLCLSDEEGRVNTPSLAEGNWTFRLSPRYRTSSLCEKIRGMLERCHRL